jgi:hypothetical protein
VGARYVLFRSFLVKWDATARRAFPECRVTLV